MSEKDDDQVEVELELEVEVIELLDKHAAERGITRDELVNDILTAAIARGEAEE